MVTSGARLDPCLIAAEDTVLPVTIVEDLLLPLQKRATSHADLPMGRLRHLLEMSPMVVHCLVVRLMVIMDTIMVHLAITEEALGDPLHTTE